VFQKCPKCNTALDPGDAEARERCPACGLIFAKYLQLGLVAMLAAYAWGAALLYFRFRDRDSGAIEEKS